MERDATGAFASELRGIIHLLVTKHYEEAANQGFLTGRVTATSVERTLTDYGATLVDLPAEAFATARVYEQVPQGWALITRDLHMATLAEVAHIGPAMLDLWTAEEGRSGLRVEIEVTLGAHPHSESRNWRDSRQSLSPRCRM